MSNMSANTDQQEPVYGRVGVQTTAHRVWGSTALCSQRYILGTQRFTRQYVDESGYLAPCLRCEAKAAKGYGTQPTPSGADQEPTTQQRVTCTPAICGHCDDEHPNEDAVRAHIAEEDARDRNVIATDYGMGDMSDLEADQDADRNVTYRNALTTFPRELRSN